MKDIWVWTIHRDGAFEDVTFGLIAEARGLLSRIGEEGFVTAVVLGHNLGVEIDKLGSFGADRIKYVKSEDLIHFQGELFATVFLKLMEHEQPYLVMMAQNEMSADLAPRVAASMEGVLVSCAMDVSVDSEGEFVVTRSKANGYLFEDIQIKKDANVPIISFFPSVLPVSGFEKREADVEMVSCKIPSDALRSRVIEVMEADPRDLDLEEADIIVSGGRGVGKGDAFKIIHELAEVLGGSVGGTRPVIDWEVLPYERQIGQTGKSVAPRLIINCGISGANEYTAGMEKSLKVIAVNKDPRARIFRFADLGVIGDVHELLPVLIDRIKQMREF